MKPLCGRRFRVADGRRAEALEGLPIRSALPTPRPVLTTKSSDDWGHRIHGIPPTVGTGCAAREFRRFGPNAPGPIVRSNLWR